MELLCQPSESRHTKRSRIQLFSFKFQASVGHRSTKHLSDIYYLLIDDEKYDLHFLDVRERERERDMFMYRWTIGMRTTVFSADQSQC